MEVIINGLDELEIANTSIEEIDNENINLIFIGLDKSGSMHRYERDMLSVLDDFKVSLLDSKESDEILVARADFSDSVSIGGYKKISDFDTSFSTGGGTALYDSIVEGMEKLRDYRKLLKDSGMRVKAVFAFFSDGEDNANRTSFSEAKAAVEYLNSEEITTAFISFGGVADKLSKDLGFKNVLKVDSSASELRKAFNCLSKSVIESSKSVVADADDFFTI